MSTETATKLTLDVKTADGKTNGTVDLPAELFEAAAIDGAGRWRILWQVVFPIVRPTISVLVVFIFIWSWNEFYIPLILLGDPAYYGRFGFSKLDHVEMVTLTASGGAFRDWPVERLVHATVAEASSHPNWSMGQRITIDSASMFNKALEVIEAHEFFGLSSDRIRVLVHPESIVHAMVTYCDGATLAHMGPPDMRHAIGHALHWPDRAALPVAALDLAALGQLTFRAPDEVRWPALRLAREVIAQGGAAGAVLNAAKEQALDDFIAGRIRFTDMAPAVAHALDRAAGRAGGDGRAVAPAEPGPARPARRRDGIWRFARRAHHRCPGPAHSLDRGPRRTLAREPRPRRQRASVPRPPH